MANQFTDRLRFLTLSAAKIDNLRQQVNQFLSRLLPQRILSRVNIFEMILNVVQDISNLNMYYIEDSIQESNILTAKSETSVRGLAELTGHSAVRPISATGSVSFNILPGLQLLTPSLIIDNLLLKNTNNALMYSMMNPEQTEQINTDNTSFVINMIEGVWKTQVIIATGVPLFIINLDDTRPIENSTFEIRVNSILYTRFDSLNDMGTSSNGYLLKNGLSNQVNIIFGDGIHGRQLLEGETVTVKYITTNGEQGNLTEIADSTRFEVINGVYDANGDSIDISDNVNIEYESGFALGSYGEHIDTTRNLAGYISRANVFVRPENLKAYLSRLTILSHIDIWTNTDDLIFNILTLPNVLAKINTYSDYLNLADSQLTLTANQQAEIRSFINTSGQQLSSTELVFRQPVLDRYAAFIYVDAQIFDIQAFKNKIFDSISRIMLEETFGDVDLQNEKIISKSSIVNAIFDLPEVNRVSVNIFSEVNEAARIAGTYDRTTRRTNGTATETIVDAITVPSTVDPNLGFTDLGDIQTGERNRIPILRGGFNKFNGANAPVELAKPIFIFRKVNNIWQEI